jgi:hypothetical protein
VYAQGFNRRYGRVGHLFQARYESRLIENETYRRVAIAYVLDNPRRAGAVRGLAPVALALERARQRPLRRGPRIDPQPVDEIFQGLTLEKKCLSRYSDGIRIQSKT